MILLEEQKDLNNVLALCDSHLRLVGINGKQLVDLTLESCKVLFQQKDKNTKEQIDDKKPEGDDSEKTTETKDERKK